MRSKRGRSTPILITLRMMVVSAIVSWLIFVNVVVYLFNSRNTGHVILATVVVALDGLVTLLLVSRLRTRLPSATDPAAFASEYRARFFLNWAVSNAVVLVGVVAALIGGRQWIFAIALPFGALGLAMISPSRAAIEHDQNRLRSVHSKINLLDVLMQTNGQVPQRVGKH